MLEMIRKGLVNKKDILSVTCRFNTAYSCASEYSRAGDEDRGSVVQDEFHAKEGP